MLDLRMLKDMPSGCVFATGVLQDHRVHDLPVRWLAKRGDGFHDWAIYYGLADNPAWPGWRILQDGDKLLTGDIIRQIVPCDDESFEFYRY